MILKKRPFSISTHKASFLFLLLLVIMVYVQPNLWLGCLTSTLAFILLITLQEVQETPRASWAIIAIIAAHILIIYINQYIVTIIPGDKKDAHTFQMTATYFTALGHQSVTSAVHIYMTFLALAYRITGENSQFFGSMLSLLAFSFSLVCLIKLLSLTEKKHLLIWVALLFSFNPNTLLWTSTTLREAYQLSFLLAASYYMLCFYKFKKVLFLPGAFAAIACFAALHSGGLLFFAVFFLLSICCYPAACSKKSKMLILFFLLAAVAITLVAAKDSNLLHPIELIKKALRYIRLYRSSVYTIGGKELSETSYYQNYPLITLTQATLALLKIWLTYLFKPFPWEIYNLKYFILAGYTFLRTCFFMLALYEVYWNKKQRTSNIFLLLLYLSNTFIWSLGTTTYGTALRHHLLTDWMILFLSAQPLYLLGQRIQRSLLFPHTKHGV